MELDSKYKVAFISAFPPLSDNHKAPNSLPFQLLKFRPADFSVDLFYYEQHDVTEDSLQLSFDQLNLNAVYKINNKSFSVFDKFKKFIRRYLERSEIKKLPGLLELFLPPQKIISQILQDKYDMIWLYPNWLFRWIEPLKSLPIVMSGMDSASLHYKRCLDKNLAMGDQELSQIKRGYEKYLYLEKRIAANDVPVHMVGKTDANFFNEISKTNLAYYVPHPHNELANKKAAPFPLNNKKKLLISGQADSIYLRNGLDQVIKMLVANAGEFRDYYELDFIGSGFEDINGELEEVGYQVKTIKWVTDFHEALISMQAQIFPITVGTGTKGKVLHAMASGLLGIGTEMAFENIEAIEGHDYLLYKNIEELKMYLLSLISKTEYYSQIAENGANAIRVNHSPERIALQFWDILKKYSKKKKNYID